MISCAINAERPSMSVLRASLTATGGWPVMAEEALPPKRGRRNLSIKERFMQYVMPDPNSGYWLWTGNRNKSGYGGFRHGYGRGPDTFAHRASYELFNGPITDGLIVRHKCDVRRCVNPDHLELGTYQDNSDDMVKRGRSRAPWRGESHRDALLTDAQVLEIKKRLVPYRYYLCKELAAEYGVSYKLMENIKNDRTWKHIPWPDGQKPCRVKS